MSGIPAIGDVVREWRRYRQISLTEFSKRTKRSKGYISELEHNKIDNPKLDKLKRIAAALGISVRDIVSRRMPDEVNEGNVASEEDMQGLTLVKVEDGEAEKKGDQISDTSLPTMANLAIGIPDSLLGGTLGDQIKEIKRLIDSVCLTDEEEEMVASQLDTTERLLKFIAAQRNIRKEG
jgi:transcriptional regulator with XRE-family HTH domain